MLKWLPSVLPILVLVLDQVSPYVQAFVSTHPKWAIILGTLGAVVAHLSPQPQKKS